MICLMLVQTHYLNMMQVIRVGMVKVGDKSKVLRISMKRLYDMLVQLVLRIPLIIVNDKFSFELMVEMYCFANQLVLFI
jgi:hypothetical protein